MWRLWPGAGDGAGAGWTGGCCRPPASAGFWRLHFRPCSGFPAWRSSASRSARAGSLSYFGLDSLHGGQLGYLLSPFVLGGNGSLGLPTTNFNLPELTYSVGILPLVAFFVLAVRAATRWRRGDKGAQPLGVWLSLCVVGIVLSLGTNTPLGHLLVHIPLYGGERLQNRNMGIVDLALAVLLALFLDVLRVDEPSPHEPSAPAPFSGEHRPTLTLGERIAGATPPVLVVALIAAMVMATGPTERLLGETTLTPGLPARMAPYYGFELALATASLFVVVRERWKRPRRRRRLATAVVLADVVVFIAMASYQPAPSGVLAARSPALAALSSAAGSTAGRSAIFNPQQRTVAYPPDVLDDLGLDDLVVLHHLESVQGYGSAVSAGYEAATGAHEVENLRPSSFTTLTFDAFDLRVLATLPEYFGTVRNSPGDLALPSGGPQPPFAGRAYLEPGDIVDLGRLAPAGPWRIGPGHDTELELPGPLALDRVAVRLRGISPSAVTRLRLVVLLDSGARRAVTVKVTGEVGMARVPVGAVLAGGGALAVEVEALPAAASKVAGRPAVPLLAAVAVHIVPWGGSVPVVSRGPLLSRTWFQLDGLLQGLLPRSAWTYQGHLGAVELYRNEAAFGPAWLQPPSSPATGSPLSVTTARAPGHVVQPRRAEWQDPIDVVSDARGALLVRSEAYSPGWSVSLEPSARPVARDAPTPDALSPPVRDVGGLQGVDLPPGRWVVSWHYRSVRAEVGLLAGVLAVLGLLVLLLVASRRRQARGEPGSGEPSDLEEAEKQPA